MMTRLHYGAAAAAMIADSTETTNGQNPSHKLLKLDMQLWEADAIVGEFWGPKRRVGSWDFLEIGSCEVGS